MADTPAEEFDDPAAEEDVDEAVEVVVGILKDGVAGAAAGAVGTAALMVGLFVGQGIGVFEVERLAVVSELVGLESNVMVGFLIFLLGGMTVWPLLFVSFSEYLPGVRWPVSGAVFGVVLWTGFVLAFYDGSSGPRLLGYAVVTLLAHVAYGAVMARVLEYFSRRTGTLV